MSRRWIALGFLICALACFLACGFGCRKETPAAPAAPEVSAPPSAPEEETAPAPPSSPPSEVVEAAYALVSGVIEGEFADYDASMAETDTGATRRWLSGDLDGDGELEWVEQVRATDGAGGDATRMTFVVVYETEEGVEARWLLREDGEPRWAERARGVSMGEFVVADATGDGMDDVFWCGNRRGGENLKSWGIWSLTDLEGEPTLRLRDVARIAAPTFDRSVTPWKITRKMTGGDAGQLTNTGARILHDDGKAFLENPVEPEKMESHESWKFEDGVFRIGALRLTDGSLDIITHFEQADLGKEAGRWGDPELFRDFNLFPEYR